MRDFFHNAKIWLISLIIWEGEETNLSSIMSKVTIMNKTEGLYLKEKLAQLSQALFLHIQQF